MHRRMRKPKMKAAKIPGPGSGHNIIIWLLDPPPPPLPPDCPGGKGGGGTEDG